MGTGTPKLEWTEEQLSGVLGALTDFKTALETECKKIDGLTVFGDTGQLESARMTKDNLIIDARALKSKLTAYIEYLDNVHAQVNGDVQFLLKL